MDILPLLPIIGKLLVMILLFNLWRLTINRQRSKGIEAPEPWGAMPLIGHLYLLKGPTPAPFRTLGAMADKHGSVFSIRLSMRRALVVSSWEAVKECFNTNDRTFMTRPSFAASKYMGYKDALFGLAPYGPYWRDMRKVAAYELLSNRRLELLKHVRASEVHTCIKDLYSLCTKNETGSTKVDMRQWFERVILNVLVQMIAGKRYGGVGNNKESQRFRRAMKEFMYLSGVFVVSNVIPHIEWMDLQGHVRSMKRNAEELDYFMCSWLEEHLQSRREGMVKEERDFIDVMLSSLSGKTSISGHKSETIIKAAALNLILAGTDTTSVTLTWALSLLLNHIKELKIVQEELDIHVGRERWVEEADIKNLVHFEYIPLSSGRRSCPGIALGSQMSSFTLARVLQSFNFATPSNARVDMSEGLGLSLPKATPLEVVLTPRLPCKLYQQ